MQSKIINFIKSVAEQHGVEVTEHKSWGNIGDLYFTKSGSLTTISTMHFDFQRTQVRFDTRTNGISINRLRGTSRTEGIDYDKLEDLEDLMQRLVGSWGVTELPDLTNVIDSYAVNDVPAIA